MFPSRSLVVSLAFLGHGVAASLDIVPGATWTAAGSNQHIQAHGAGITEVDGTYYMIGENKLNGSSFQSINCYSSTDLVNWTFENELLSLQSSGDLGPNCVVERPKVIYNEDSGQYVMWLHIDSSDYGEAKAGVATGASVCGEYTYTESAQPLGYQSRDIGLYKDTDGTAYLLTEDRENGLRIDQLSSDYLTVESNVYTWPESYESPAIYKSDDGTYFMFGSQLTGWDPNDNRYCTATSLSGPWTDWTNFAPSGQNTFNSQTTFVLDVNGLVIYMGDRWLSDDLSSSSYIWLPLTISGTTASIDNDSPWTPNLSDGTWAPLSSTTTIPAGSSGTLGGSAEILSCDGCSSDIVGYIGGADGGTLTFESVSFSQAGQNTVQISYGNGDSTQRFCSVLVNGEAHTVAFVPTGGPQSLLTSVLNANFEADGNVISFEGLNGEYCPDIEGIVVA